MNTSDQYGSPGGNISISQMMKLFEGLDETEEKLHILEQLFSFSRDFICVTGPEGYFKRVSNSFCHALGYTKEELLSKPQEYFMVDKYLEGIGFDSDSEEDDTDSCVHNRYRCKDGTIKWFAWRYADFTADQHQYAIGRDI